MNLGFVIVAHDEPEAVSRLVDRLTSQGGIVALHWDARHPVDLSRRLRETLPASQAARVIAAERIEVHWGLWTVVQATLNGLEALERSGAGLDYVTLLSGHDYPLRPLEQMRAFLADHAGIEHIECVDHEKGRWVTDGLHDERWQYRHYFSWGTHPWLFDRCWHLQRHLGLRRKSLPGCKPHFGSQWWTLSWSTLRQILAASREPEVRRFFRRTWVPDEMFFQTLVAKAVPPEKISGSGLNFYHFTPQGTPLVFHNDQLDFLARQPHFFARKISPRALRLKGALDALADKRSRAITPRLPLQKQLGEYPLHVFRAKNPHPNKRLFGRTENPQLGDLGRNTSPYIVFARETATTEFPVPDHLPINMVRFGELFAAERIDYGAGPQHPLYPADSPALRDQAPANFLFDLIRTHENATIAFDLVGPCPEPLARILAEDRKGEVFLPPLREQNAAASATDHSDETPVPGSTAKGPSLNHAESPAPARSSASIESRTQASGEILRFGNYIICAGTLPADILEKARREDFQYRFPGLASNRIPDFAFHSAPLTPDGFCPDEQAAPPMARFVHFFWFCEAHELNLGGNSPAQLQVAPSSRGPQSETFKLDRFFGADGERFVAALRSLDIDDVWLCRLTLEIGSLPELSAAAKIAFSAEISRRCPNEAASFAPALPAEEVRTAQFLYFLANYGPVGLPPFLQDVNYASDTAVEPALLNTELVYSNLEHVAMLGHRDKALALASEALRLAQGDRGKIAAAICTLCPRYSKWWLFQVLSNTGVGPEQAADALNTAAAGTRQSDPKLAELLYDAALIIAPEAQSAALSSGWLALEHGDIAKAKTSFTRVTRHHASSNLVTPWPQISDAPWPDAPLVPELFELPQRATKWPRISIVTPSYNQGQYIEETILSVLNQGYPNLQYILVDGASTDGTREILERYWDRIDVLIIEPDDGQTQAINKGLKLADGELLAWLNSDDMYAPGALHMAAWSWMQTQADVIAGICLEHSDQKFATINKPAAKPEEFTVENLSLIFERWFQGDFFYQPEVFFTKSLLNRVGPLDDTLNYAMDGELWMRFAASGARLAVEGWPFALFRKHAAQKTATPMPWLREQAAVRARYSPAPHASAKRRRVRKRLEELKQSSSVNVYFPRSALKEDDAASLWLSLQHLLGENVALCTTTELEADVLCCVPWQDEAGIQQATINHYPHRPLLVGWMNAQPHQPFLAYSVAQLFDVILCPDEQDYMFLRGPNSVFASDLLCSN